MSWGIGDRVGVAVSAGTIATFNSRRPGPVPSLVLDFAGTGTLDPRVTFTRSTTARYYNSSGVLTTAAINAPRFDYNPSTLAPLGLLIEQSSTNLLTYSQDFSNVIWTKNNSTITTGADIAPDGTQTAQMLVEATGTVTPFLNEVAVKTASAITHTYSSYIKANQRTYAWTQLSDGFGNGARVYFNLSTGVISTAAALVGTGFTSPSATITSVGNGWYRCTITATSNTALTIAGYTGISNNGSTVTYTGNGTSGIYIWGAQIETGSFATSYIPTTSAQVTRAADNASMTGTNFSSWFNQGQGTVYSEIASFTTFALGNNRVGWQIDSGSGFTNRYVYNQTSSAMTVIVGGSVQANFSIPAPAAKAFTKNAFAYQTSLFNDSYNGTALSTITSGSIPTVSRLILGDDAISNSTPLNGWIKKFAFYPQALTSAQLQALTT